MPTCGEGKLFVLIHKGEGFRCLGKRCGATKVTPEKRCRQASEIRKEIRFKSTSG